MATWLSAVADRPSEPQLPPWSKKTLFTKSKHSEEWHAQIRFTAGAFRPSDKKFPWTLVRKHTDHYLKKKGKINQTQIDVRLAALIEKHEARDVAIAACAHVMSPTAVRALLNVELNVAPATFHGLEMYLQSLIAANFCNPKAVSGLEAQWAHSFLRYATHGSNAAKRFLEGLCATLRMISTPNMNVLPDFTILARRAIKTFATRLEGYKLRCQWASAHAAVAWMAALAQSSPAVTPPGHLLPEHVFDVQFPIWRIWAAWKPNLERIAFLGGVSAQQRGVLPDMMALEGPDFMAGTYATLREGLISQYGAEKPLVRFRGLIISIVSCTKDELRDKLERTASVMDMALKAGSGPFSLFSQLTIARPITQDSFQVIEAASKIRDTPKSYVHNAIAEIYLAQNAIGGRHISELQHLICALDDSNGKDLQKVLLRPWLVQGIEKCFQECQTAVRKHIETGLTWTHLATELHTFCAIVKESQSCLPLIDVKMREQLDILPSADELRTIIDIYKITRAEKNSKAGSAEDGLKNAIEAWCIDRVMERGTIGHASKRTVEAIMQLWIDTSNDKEVDMRRSLAIMASKSAGVDWVVRCKCFQQIPALPNELVKGILDVLQAFKAEPEWSCIAFTRLLAHAEDVEHILCWQKILHGMIELLPPMAIIDYALKDFEAWKWSEFILNLNTLFADLIGPKDSPPYILRPHLHLWVQQLSEYLPTITRLEEAFGDHSSAVKVILRGGEGLWVEYLVRILEALNKAYEQPAESLMQKVVGKLSGDGQNASEIANCVQGLLGASPEGLAACERIYDAKHGVVNIPGIEQEQHAKMTSVAPKPSKHTVRKPVAVREETIPIAVAEVIVAGWLQDDDLLDNDRAAIRLLAFFLGLEIYGCQIPKGKLEEAVKYFAEQEAILIEEEERLHSVAQALKARDPIGSKIVFAELGLPDTSLLDDEIASLPVGIIDHVEKQGNNVVEISFPLTSLTDLERSATGIGTANTLLLRLYLDYDGNVPPSFCVHLDNHPQPFNTEHTSWVCFPNSKPPEQAYCAQKSTLLTWQLSRILHRHLKANDPGIATVYNLVKSRMEDLAHGCIVCDTTHNVLHTTKLRRSTPCSLSSCMRIWNNLSLDVLVPELRADIFAVDMILTTVYAAAVSGRSELLPGCPFPSTTVTFILNALPPLLHIKNAKDLSSALKAVKDAEKLIVWACTHYRGCIATATGICKIPGFPTGTHQFVVANTNPRQESDFLSKVPKTHPQTRVLFHGTSLDRLPNILATGLRTYSGTPLQRTGASYGKGIYMGEEPATSFSYSPSAVSWRNSGLNNMRLLLGCEVVGNGRSVSTGIHVITDEKTVMVRYVFLLTNSAYAPVANHVVPALGSAMSALRSGAV